MGVLERLLIGNLTDEDRRKLEDAIRNRHPYFVFEVNEIGKPLLLDTCTNKADLYARRYIGRRIIREYDYVGAKFIDVRT